MNKDFLRKLQLLQVAPKSPLQLQDELIDIIKSSFTLEVATLVVAEDKDEFALTIRSKVKN